MKLIFRYLVHHDVRSDHGADTISFYSLFMILAYRGDRPHYLSTINQTIQCIDVAAAHPAYFIRDSYNNSSNVFVIVFFNSFVEHQKSDFQIYDLLSATSNCNATFLQTQHTLS